MEVSTRKENGVPITPLPPMQFAPSFFTPEVMSGKVEPTPGIHFPEWNEQYANGNIYNSLLTDVLSNIKSGRGPDFVMQVCQCMRTEQPTQSDIIVLLMW